MPLYINEQPSEADWEKMILAYNFPPFLQSWHAGEMHKEIGDEIFRLGLYDDQKLVGGVLAIKIMAKRGNFLYCPYGPIINWHKPDQVEIIFKAVKQKAEKLGLTFVRVSPFLADTNAHRAIFTNLGYRPAPIHMLAEHLWFLDVDKDEALLMSGMRKTTRNLVRRAIKEGVTVDQRDDDEAINAFIKLHDETVKRQHFVPYPAKYFRAQIKNFTRKNNAKVFLAYHQNQILAAAIIIFYGQTGSYHHGASVAHGNIPASYLLQWEAIKETKKRGVPIYNFWGIVPAKLSKGHPWAGLSLFKTGFGGYQFDLVPCHDLELRPKYYATYLIERYRKWRRKV